MFEIGREELLDDARLQSGAFRLAQRYQPVRVPRRACLAAEPESDPELFADRLHAREDDGDLGSADDGLEVFPFIDARGGRLGVQVIGVPGDGEGVGRVRVGRLVERDAAFKFLFPDVALLSNFS